MEWRASQLFAIAGKKKLFITEFNFTMQQQRIYAKSLENTFMLPLTVVAFRAYQNSRVHYKTGKNAFHWKNIAQKLFKFLLSRTTLCTPPY